MNLNATKQKYPGYGKNVLNPLCAICTEPTGTVSHQHQMPRIPTYIRALYFDAQDDVDFCGPDCSLTYYTKKYSAT